MAVSSSFSSSRWACFWAGVRDTTPMLVGAAPFGLIFGTLAAASPLAPWQGQGLSLLVFAGSSQFIALGLIASGAGLVVIWLTTLVVNLRHALYAAALLPVVAPLAGRWRWGLGFLLTDETFAVVVSGGGRYAPLTHWYFLGSGLAMYANWQVWTLAGLLFGAGFPSLSLWGLDFAMVVTFIAVVVPQLVTGPRVGAALVAGALAFVGRGLPFQLGLLLAVLGGVVAGLTLVRFEALRRGRARRG